MFHRAAIEAGGTDNGLPAFARTTTRTTTPPMSSIRTDSFQHRCETGAGQKRLGCPRSPRQGQAEARRPRPSGSWTAPSFSEGRLMNGEGGSSKSGETGLQGSAFSRRVGGLLDHKYQWSRWQSSLSSSQVVGGVGGRVGCCVRARSSWRARHADSRGASDRVHDPRRRPDRPAGQLRARPRCRRPPERDVVAKQIDILV